MAYNDGVLIVMHGIQFSTLAAIFSFSFFESHSSVLPDGNKICLVRTLQFGSFQSYCSLDVTQTLNVSSKLFCNHQHTYGEMQFGVPHIVQCFSFGIDNLAARPKSPIFCRRKKRNHFEPILDFVASFTLVSLMMAP